MLFNNQQEHLQQLQLQNQQLQNQFSSLQNLTSAAFAAAVAAMQSLPIPTFSSTSIRPVKGADPEKFSGDHGNTDGFIRAIKLAIAVQPTSFRDERTKMLYGLSFMTKGTAEVWAHNQTQAIIDGTSSISTFEAFIKQVENTFGDPDRSRTAENVIEHVCR